MIKTVERTNKLNSKKTLRLNAKKRSTKMNNDPILKDIETLLQCVADNEMSVREMNYTLILLDNAYLSVQCLDLLNNIDYSDLRKIDIINISKVVREQVIVF